MPTITPIGIESTGSVGRPRALYSVPLPTADNTQTMAVLMLICQQRWFDCYLAYANGNEEHVFGEDRDTLLKIADRMRWPRFFNAWLSYYNSHGTHNLFVTLPDILLAHTLFPEWVPDPVNLSP